MSNNYLPLIAERVLGRPLLMAPTVAEAMFTFLNGFGGRIGGAVDEVAPAVPAASGFIGSRRRPNGYALTRAEGNTALIPIMGSLVNRGAWLDANACTGLTSYEGIAAQVREATAELGIPAEQLTVHDFDVRTFPVHRQEILELLTEIWNDWEPDCVFQPSLHDVHQDHRTIAEEGLRAFKRTTILGYEIPWNNFDFEYQWYVALEQSHIERKIAALEKYASQQHRRYANAEYVRNLARTHGVNVNREYAEVFQVYRVVA